MKKTSLLYVNIQNHFGFPLHPEKEEKTGAIPVLTELNTSLLWLTASLTGCSC